MLTNTPYIECLGGFLVSHPANKSHPSMPQKFTVTTGDHPAFSAIAQLQAVPHLVGFNGSRRSRYVVESDDFFKDVFV